LWNVYLPSKAAVPHMIKNGGKSIMNIATIGSVVPDLLRMAYFLCNFYITGQLLEVTGG